MMKLVCLAGLLLVVSLGLPVAQAEGHNCDMCVLGKYPPTAHCKEHCRKAKVEGRVNVYSVFPLESLKVLIAEFEKLVPFPIKVSVTRAPGSRLVSEVVAMGRAGAQKADLVLTSDTTMGLLLQSEFVTSSPSPSEERFLAPFKDPKQRWLSPVINPVVIVYNPRMVSGEESPKSWKDLLDPQWKGRFVMSYMPDFFGPVLQGIEGQGFAYARKLTAIAPAFKGSAPASIRAVAQGEFAITLGYAGAAVELAKKRAPIEINAPNPLPVRLYPAGLVNGAAHPNAGLMFYEFLISEGVKRC